MSPQKPRVCRRVFYALVALLVIMVIARPDAGQRLVKLAETATVFSGPTEDSTAIATLAAGTEVQMYPRVAGDREWLKVTLPGVFPRVGYLATRFVAAPETSPVVISPTLEPANKMAAGAPRMVSTPIAPATPSAPLAPVPAAATTVAPAVTPMPTPVKPEVGVAPMSLSAPVAAPSPAMASPVAEEATAPMPAAVAAPTPAIARPALSLTARGLGNPRVAPAARAASASASNAASEVAVARRQLEPPASVDVRAAMARGHQLRGEFAGLNLSDSARSFLNAMGAVSSALNKTPVNQANTSSGFSVQLFTPQTWITQIASDAAKEYREVDAQMFQPEDFESVLRVIVHPDTPTYVSAAGMLGTSSVRHVVIRDAQRKTVIQPVLVEPWTEKVSNAMGGKAVFVGVQALFTLDDFRRLRGSDDQEFFITVIGASGEEKDFKVKKKHFEHLPVR
jgi:hypothetical protein